MNLFRIKQASSRCLSEVRNAREILYLLILSFVRPFLIDGKRVQAEGRESVSLPATSPGLTCIKFYMSWTARGKVISGLHSPHRIWLRSVQLSTLSFLNRERLVRKAQRMILSCLNLVSKVGHLVWPTSSLEVLSNGVEVISFREEMEALHFENR